MSIKNLIEMIKHNGLLASMAQLEKLYQAAIENEQKLAELEARCAALAAENAGLKKVPATDSETMLLALDAFNTHGSMRPDVGLQQAINVVMQRRETPATDTFLAEVRAQAVEMFAKEMHADISGDDAREFAAQLRKGAAS